MIFDRKENTRREGERRSVSAVTNSKRSGSAPDTARKHDESPSEPRRIKRLATIAAAAVAVALVSAGYGTWAAMSAKTTVDAAQADTQPTLVASVDMKAGEVIQPASVETRAIPQSFRVQNALAPEAVNEDPPLIGRRVLVDMPAGTQLSSSVVSGSVEAGHLASALNSGLQAVTIGVDAEAGLAGQLRPMDRVRVVAWTQAMGETTALETVCEDVRILSLDGALSGAEAGYTSVTIEVTSEQANAVRSAQFAGKVSFVLHSVLDSTEEQGGLGTTGSEALSADGVLLGSVRAGAARG